MKLEQLKAECEAFRTELSYLASCPISRLWSANEWLNRLDHRMSDLTEHVLINCVYRTEFSSPEGQAIVEIFKDIISRFGFVRRSVQLSLAS